MKLAPYYTIASPHVGIELSIFFCGESRLYISAILSSVGITFKVLLQKAALVSACSTTRKPLLFVSLCLDLYDL